MSGTRSALIVMGVLLLAMPALGWQQTVSFTDTTSQDIIPTGVFTVDELGNKPPFPDDEWITSSSVVTPYVPCSQNPDTAIPNIEVTITNMTQRAFHELYYVADPQTSLTNDDGIVNTCLAFRIDAQGFNRPLVFESQQADGIFASGETWKFVIQDYVNTLGLPASALASIGVGSGSQADPDSSGSIITPEPATLAFVALMGTILIKRRS